MLSQFVCYRKEGNPVQLNWCNISISLRIPVAPPCSSVELQQLRNVPRQHQCCLPKWKHSEDIELAPVWLYGKPPGTSCRCGYNKRYEACRWLEEFVQRGMHPYIIKLRKQSAASFLLSWPEDEQNISVKHDRSPYLACTHRGYQSHFFGYKFCWLSPRQI